MIRRILAIAKNTFKETLRDRILVSVLLLTLAFIGFSLFAGSISLGQNARIIVDFGLTGIYILQIFVAIFIGSMLIYKEIERKTFFLLIPKPLRREEIILGKCLGLSATTFAVTALSTLALCGVLFVSGIGGFSKGILLSVSLSFVESIILILISILFSGLTSPVLSAVYTTAFFLIGHSGSILRDLIATQTSMFSLYALKAAYYLLPNLEKFNIRNEVVYGTLPDLKWVLLSLLYALLYGILLFIFARAMFARKEF